MYNVCEMKKQTKRQSEGRTSAKGLSWEDQVTVELN